jgi:chloramphenicol-sensitive protein RarD
VGHSSGAYRSGLLFGLIAYLWWGLVPVYFREIRHVGALEILAHRICWSIGLMAALTAVTGTWGELIRVLGSRKLVLTMLLSATLLAINWLLYIYATVTDRVAEASLGYYMMPLVNAFLGTVFLGEKLRPAHYPALSLVAIGVAVPFVAAGDLTWIAVALPITFGFYGLVRKMAPVDSLTGLSVETLIMALPSAGYLVWLAVKGAGHFGVDLRTDLLLGISGVVTIVPLLTFTLSIRRLPLLAISFIQFLSPTMQLLTAVFWFHEPVSPAMWGAIGCIWLAVAIFVSDAVVQSRALAPRVTSSTLRPEPRIGDSRSELSTFVRSR